MGGEDSGIRVARYRPGPDVGVGDNGSRVDRAVVFGLVSRTWTSGAPFMGSDFWMPDHYIPANQRP